MGLQAPFFLTRSSLLLLAAAAAAAESMRSGAEGPSRIDDAAAADARST